MRRERGFSLAELLMALLILTLVITTSMAAFVEKNRRQQQAREIVLAYQALANEAEYWRRIDYKSLADSTEFQSKPEELLTPLRPYETTITVADTKPPHIKNVRLTIKWNGGARQAQLELVRVDTGGDNLW